MSILFQPVCFPSSSSYSFNFCQIIYHLFATVFASSVPSCLCFPALPPLFLQGRRFLNQVSIFILVKSLHSFPPMFVSGDSQDDTNGASSSSFFVLFLLRRFQFKRCRSYLSLFQMFFHVP